MTYKLTQSVQLFEKYPTLFLEKIFKEKLLPRKEQKVHGARHVNNAIVPKKLFTP
jgi:hypothetical protein